MKLTLSSEERGRMWGCKAKKKRNMIKEGGRMTLRMELKTELQSKCEQSGKGKIIKKNSKSAERTSVHKLPGHTKGHDE
jgi:hypothetical protein